MAEVVQHGAMDEVTRGPPGLVRSGVDEAMQQTRVDLAAARKVARNNGNLLFTLLL